MTLNVLGTLLSLAGEDAGLWQSRMAPASFCKWL